MKEEKEFYSIGRGSLNLNGKFYYGLDYAITDFMRSLEEENKSLQSQLKEKEEENEQLKDRITNAIERLEALIIFWKKYNPIDNTMQVEQFNGVISLLKEDNKEKVDDN